MIDGVSGVGDRTAALLAEIEREFPGFRLVRKDRSRLHRLIDRLLRALTLGAMSDYLNGYHTTVGRTVYVAAGWDAMSDAGRYLVLRHERVHLRQFRRFTLPGMVLLYLLVPLPVGLAWFRARCEREAYADTVRTTAELHGIAAVRDPAFRRHIIGHFLGPGYGWMWPFRRSLERWYDRLLGELEPDRPPGRDRPGSDPGPAEARSGRGDVT